MPLKLSSDDLRGSARSALSPVPPGNTNKAEDREFAWNRFRAATAQAILADPDTMVYLKLRKMKGLVRPVSELHGLLCMAITLSELAVRPEDVGVPVEETDTSRLSALLTSGDYTSLDALQRAAASAFKNEVRREVRRGYARPVDAEGSLPLILQEITRRARGLYQICVRTKNLIADHRRVLYSTAADPVRERAALALEEREGLDRVLAVSSAIGALRVLDEDPARDSALLSQHRQGAAFMSGLMRAMSGLLEVRSVARSRAEAAREVSFYGNAAAMMAPLTTEASRAFGLLFLDLPDDSLGLIGELRSMTVEVSAATKAAAHQILDSCAAEGFDSAYRELEMGYPVRLSYEGFLSATRVGAISEVTGDLTYRSG